MSFSPVTEGAGGVQFNKLVVIKRLREHVAEDPEFVTMLIDEGRHAARLNHPNVVQTLEVGRERGELFLAMEYLDGQSSTAFSPRGRETFPLAMHLAVLTDVLVGIHDAHELEDFDRTPLNIVHRDATPHNVFVTYNGQVKVVDFGIAKAEGRASETRQRDGQGQDPLHGAGAGPEHDARSARRHLFGRRHALRGVHPWTACGKAPPTRMS